MVSCAGQIANLPNKNRSAWWQCTQLC